jgi:uncharacterized membrane protein YGL010W
MIDILIINIKVFYHENASLFVDCISLFNSGLRLFAVSLGSTCWNVFYSTFTLFSGLIMTSSILVTYLIELALAFIFTIITIVTTITKTPTGIAIPRTRGILTDDDEELSGLNPLAT